MRKSKTIMIGALSALVLGVGGAALAAPGLTHGGDVTRAQAQERATAMFSRLDANGDGVINDADREARVVKRFDALDKDSNGSISREEFVAGRDHKRGEKLAGGEEGKPGWKGRHGGGKHFGGRHFGGMRGGFTEKADTNGDGVISAAEFSAAHLARFDAADANKDGIVTKEERKAAFEAKRAERKERKQAE
ncbi:EF-hand domain-containing protein [Tsuneonella sp. CC-YZS046]|uniref:EF-hand domain-containing protein n=1 Tax=Tsuneonella sp. CC-YZS046 TaxID=3042152 RepID=UPI002D787511|nr:EF-hand domain-containing protein [Tsuneonella sp. CC-YZS046]WRO66429.1 EF-hand domain-containing protein [Tsuneonella sp. CC-YZS046]